MKLLKMSQLDYVNTGLILIISLITVADLFINTGKPTNGDGLVHTVMPALFAQAMKAGQFPVSWTDGFANYGFPLGSIAQQLTTYLTAILIFLTHNPSIAFNIMVFIGVLLSNIFFYKFLRLYFQEIASLAGIFLYNFTSYRLLNIYVRGALPEFFAGVFMPMLLISVYLIIKKSNVYGIFLYVASICLLTLTHPFMLIVSMFLLVPYAGFLLYESNNLSLKQIVRYICIFTIATVIGLGLTAYYSLPLNAEIKYFYYGKVKSILAYYHFYANFLMPSNFMKYNWYYFYSSDVGDRGFIINVGIIETIVLIAGSVYFLKDKLKTRFKKLSILDYAVISSGIVLLMTTSLAAQLYAHISLLSNIQFPWRMLSAFIFLPPIILAFLIEKYSVNRFLILVIIAVICVLSFPQLYGKNYRIYSFNDYLFTPYNLHAVVMNPIWTGKSEDYPIKDRKWDIIGGQGLVIPQHTSNVNRTYSILAKTPLQLVDYTFYFPGWKAYVDGQEISIEYQNPKYRGVITYSVPSGSHTVVLKYTDTKVRFLGKVITLFFLVLFVVMAALKTKIAIILKQ